MPQTNPPELVTLAEAAKFFGVNPKTIRRRIDDGTIVGYRFGPRVLRVDKRELESALQQVPLVDR